MSNEIDLDYFRDKLLEQRKELEELSAKSSATRDAVELDQTRQGRLSRQDALMQQEMAKEAERRRQLNIQRIDAALKRIREGDYGYCLQCDEPIARKRLEWDPSVSLCIECASGG